MSKTNPSDVVVREAVYSDGDVLCGMWLELLHYMAHLDTRVQVADDARRRWIADYPIWLRNDGRCILIAEIHTEPVGYVSSRLAWPLPIFREAVELYVDEIYVSPTHRRSGIGQRLVSTVRAWGEQHGAFRVRLQTLSLAPESRAFWAALGGSEFAIEYVIDDGEESAATGH
jgi:GNAT superfamily N-acetyltransferase